MQVTRVKEDVNAISYELLRRNGLSVKFRVKTRYSSGLNNKETYYYTPYAFNTKNKKSYSINISPRSYIQFDFGTEGGTNIFFLSENHKNKFIRNVAKQVAMLNAYEDGKIDIIKVDQSGTHISNKYPVKEEMRLGVHVVSTVIVIRQDKMDIGVQINIDKMSAVIAMNDFLDLITKLNSINYTSMTMSLLNYLGIPEDLEYNMVDFRPTKIVSNDREFTAPIAGSKSPLSGLDINKQASKTYNKPMSW